MKKNNTNELGVVSHDRLTKIILVCGVSLALLILDIRISENVWWGYLALSVAFVLMDVKANILPITLLLLLGVIAVGALLQLGILWIPIVVLVLPLLKRRLTTDEEYERLISEVTQSVQDTYPGAVWDWENRDLKLRFLSGRYLIRITEADGLSRHRYWCLTRNKHCVGIEFVESKDNLRNEDYQQLLLEISNEVRKLYPDSIWDWENSEVKNRLKDGKFVIVITEADGIIKHRYWCLIEHLTCVGLSYIETKGKKRKSPKRERKNEELHTGSEEKLPKEVLVNTGTEAVSMKMPDPVDWDDLEPYEADYSLAAFEWVELHLKEINEMLNEAIGNGETGIILSGEELPPYREELVKQLSACGMTGFTVSMSGNNIVIDRGGEENAIEKF